MTTVDPIEARILGVLVEKQMTTPDAYPLTLAGVVAGSNQSTNRHPVMSVTDEEVEAALIRLHDGGLATPVRRPGDRATKYRHKLAEALELGTESLAVLAVLLLRGAQTSGELRQRTERYATFQSIDEVEAVIDRLEEEGLAERLSRQPGQSQRRVAQLLGDPDPEAPISEAVPLAPDPPDLEARVAALEDRFTDLLRRLGETDL
ncbi:YceH family protein [soil metagenome]